MESITNIFKVYRMADAETIESIYVFFGKKVDANEQAKLVYDIFSKEEVESMDENTNVEFIDERIYLDDTIDQIYLKVQKLIQTQASFDEMYMFAQSKHIFRSEEVFAALTENGTKTLAKFDFEVFLTNTNIPNPENLTFLKEVLSLNDIIALGLDGTEMVINVQPGNRQWILPFLTNPYMYSSFFDTMEPAPLQSSQVLLNTGPLLGNKLYLVTARELLQTKSNDDEGDLVDEDHVLEMYYPGLAKASTLEKVITPETQQYFNVVDLFYEVFFYKKTNLNYLQKGITQLEAIFQTSTALEIDVETIFKVIHASDKFLSIAYIRDPESEPIYRLFTNNQKTEKNEPVPVLINNLNKKDIVLSSALYINTPGPLSFVFQKDGSILILLDTEKPLSVDAINEEVKKYVNHFITLVNQYLKESGFKFSLFTSLVDPQIKVNTMSLSFEYQALEPAFTLDGNECASKIFQKNGDVIVFTRASGPFVKTIFDFNKDTRVLKASIMNLDSIFYVLTVPVYIDTLLRLMDYPDSTRFPMSQIQSLCFGQSEPTLLKEEVKTNVYAFDNFQREKERKLKAEEGEVTEGVREETEGIEEEPDDSYLLPREKDFFSFGEPEERAMKRVQKGGYYIETEPDLTEDTEDDVKLKEEEEDEDDVKLTEEEEEDDEDEDEDEEEGDVKLKEEEEDPIVILKNHQNRYQSFSRLCDSETKRQPIGLTDKELESFLRENNDVEEEGDVLKYAPNINYICPRYWCVDNKTAVNASDIQTHEGRLVHPTCRNVIELSSEKKYPGLTKGSCLPCCFDSYNKLEQTQLNETCEKEKVQSPEAFPLAPNQLGFLPPAVQKLFPLCTETSGCLLRVGTDQKANQSFLSSIAALISYDYKTKRAPMTIKELKDKLIRSFTLDNFVTFHNGNLVNEFYIKTNANANANATVNISDYYDTALWRRIHKKNSQELDYFQRVIQSYENFKQFLMSAGGNVKIDYTFLWDILTRPKSNIFPNENGVNLIILEIPNDDITSNVKLICPTSFFSSHTFNAKLPSVFILKQNNYFEPLLQVKNNTIMKYFQFNNLIVHSFLEHVALPYFTTLCHPVNSLPVIYKAKRPTRLSEALTELVNEEFIIKNLVLNFQNKVIGIMTSSANDNKLSGFVPVFPSGIPTEDAFMQKTIFMTHPNIWSSYEKTVELLIYLSEFTSIKVKPQFMVIEDKMVVGVLTEADQFVQINPPSQVSDIPSDLVLKKMEDRRYLGVNKEATKVESTKKRERSALAGYIEKETLFYSWFRRKVRSYLLDNRGMMESIESEATQPFTLYETKLKNVIDLLLQLVQDKIIFMNLANMDLDNMQTCSNISTPGSKCELMLPKENLISGKENKTLYFSRFADELIRNNKYLSSFMNPRFFVPFQEVQYEIEDNEMIVPESMLSKYTSLVPREVNSFMNSGIPFTEAEPILSIHTECGFIDTDELTPANLWHFCFNQRTMYREIVFTCLSSLVDTLVNLKTATIEETNVATVEEAIKVLEKYNIPTLFLVRGDPEAKSTSSNLEDAFAFVSTNDKKEFRVVVSTNLNSLFIPLGLLDNEQCFAPVRKAILKQKGEKEEDTYDYEEVVIEEEDRNQKKPFLQDLMAMNFNFLRGKKSGGTAKRSKLRYINHKRTYKRPTN